MAVRSSWRSSWSVEIADAEKVKGLAPLVCKADRIDAWVLAELARRDPCRRSGCPTGRCAPSGSGPGSACISSGTAALSSIGSTPCCWPTGDHGVDAPGPYRAARDLLLGRGPRLASTDSEPLVAPGEQSLHAACRLVTQLDGGCLAIQGPPGAGKTYTGAHMILELHKHRQRVGITAQSHAVISNFLAALDQEAKNSKVVVSAIQKADDIASSVVRSPQRAHSRASSATDRHACPSFTSSPFDGSPFCGRARAPLAAFSGRAWAPLAFGGKR